MRADEFPEHGNWDIHGFQDQFKRQKKQTIEAKISRKNKKQILDFVKDAEIENISLSQRIKYLSVLRQASEIIPKDFCDWCIEDCEDYILTLKQRNYKTTTQETKWMCLRKLLHYTGKEAILEKLKPRFTSKGIDYVEGDKIISLSQCMKMIDAAPTTRNKAIVSTFYEGGPRAGEFLTSAIGDTYYQPQGIKVMVNGKTGKRPILLVWSAPYLDQWLKEHPHKENPKAPLWLDSVRPHRAIGYRGLCRILEKLAKSADIQQHITPHMFRHSHATELLRQGMPEQLVKKRMGWTRDSDMIKVYEHLTHQDVDDAYQRLIYGKQKSEVKPDMQEFMDAFMQTLFKVAEDMQHKQTIEVTER